MDDARSTKKIHQKRLKGRSKNRRRYYVKNDKWRQIAWDMDGWRRATREVLILFE